jgi:hypothetical protein
MQILSMEELIDFLKSEGVTSISFPQFERIDEITPVMPDGSKEFFDSLKTLSHETLTAVGLGLWDDGHYLFPKEWYNFIPDGYMVTSISGNIEPFKRGETDDDIRYGMLAYGFIK